MDRRDGISFLPGIAGDRALLARLTAGEEAAYRECYQLHAPVLMRLLMRLLRNQAAAEDILQETFAAAFRSVGQFRGEARISTWLAGIAMRRALNELRGAGRRAKHEEAAVDEGSSPEPYLADREETRKVLALLDQMDPQKRLAILLQAEGYTAAEIADLSGEPRNTILSRLARGRAELAERALAAGLSSPEGRSAKKEVR